MQYILSQHGQWRRVRPASSLQLHPGLSVHQKFVPSTKSWSRLLHSVHRRQTGRPGAGTTLNPTFYDGAQYGRCLPLLMLFKWDALTVYVNNSKMISHVREKTQPADCSRSQIQDDVSVWSSSIFQQRSLNCSVLTYERRTPSDVIRDVIRHHNIS